MTGFHPYNTIFDHKVLQDHVENWTHYIFSNRTSINTNVDSKVTYYEALPPL